MNLKKQYFVFVHGACHGAWCWYKVEALLKLAGHQVTSLDMAAGGIDPKQINELHSISDYFEPLTMFMESVPAEERVVLVGHSYGGMGLCMAMEKFPEKIGVAVFVAASMPGPELSLADLGKEASRGKGSDMDNQFGYDDGPDKPATSFSFGPIFMSVNVYQACSLEDMTLATKLLRPQRLFSDKNLEEEIKMSDAKYGSVSRAFVVTGDDKLALKDFQQYMIENNPPDKVREISGSDHMAMLSKSDELYACLVEIAECFS